MLDQLNLRFKYVLAFLIGAVIAAAALRHGAHIYGGFSREEIRVGALMAIPFVALAIIVFRRIKTPPRCTKLGRCPDGGRSISGASLSRSSLEIPTQVVVPISPTSGCAAWDPL